jgi:hypothetical protein
MVYGFPCGFAALQPWLVIPPAANIAPKSWSELCLLVFDSV